MTSHADQPGKDAGGAAERGGGAVGDRVGRGVPAWRSGGAWAVLLATVVLAVGVDLVSKDLAFRYVAGAPVRIDREQVLAVGAEDPRLIGTLLPRHEPVTVVPGLLDFTLVLNPGAVFGVGPGQRWFFVSFTVAAIGFGAWMFAFWTGVRDRAAHIGLGLLLGGGLGNLYDRVVYACVRDFIHPLPGVRFPFGWRPLGGTGEVWPYVSNVADLLLLIGIAMLLVVIWRRDRAAAAAQRRAKKGSA